jgi:hypothetical protein
MYNSKLAQLIDEAINNCITYGEGKAEGDGLVIMAEWNQNEKDIEVYMMRDGVILGDWLEKDVIDE